MLRNLVMGIKALFHREQRNQEMDEELRSYLESAVEEKMLYAPPGRRSGVRRW
jgi:hypothetical protein